MFYLQGLMFLFANFGFTALRIFVKYEWLEGWETTFLSCCCSVAQLCPTFWDPMDCCTPGFPILHCLSELAQTHVHWVNDAIPPSHPLSFSSPPAFSLSQHQGLFQWVGSSHQVANVLELQPLHQSFQWTFSIDFP